MTPREEFIDGKLGIGVIGAGNFAQSMLLPALKKDPQAILQGVTTTTPVHTRDVADRFGFTYAASVYEDLLKDPFIKAILIATRHDTHAGLSIDALQAGKAVHVEKPLAMNTAELSKVIQAYQEAQEKNGAFLMVGFNRRFAPMVKKIQQFFIDHHQPLSILYRINAGYLPLDHWTQDPVQGGGRVIGEVCHFIDLLQFLTGSKVLEIYASSLPNLGIYNDDNLTITSKHEDGSIGTIIYLANGDKAWPKEYIEVFGDGKIAVLENFRRITLINQGRKRVFRNGAQDKGHRAEMAAWINAIRTGSPEPVPFDQAVTTTKASFAVLRSLVERIPITLE